jgi:ribose transport system substrate-binding protein
MGVTIKEIAELSGVSAATVSHIINKTRYVSPELERRVRLVMDQTGYSAKLIEKESNLAVGKESTIAFVVPDLSIPFYASLAGKIGSLLLKEGYVMSAYSSNDDPIVEKHILRDISTNMRVGGVILASDSDNLSGYAKMLNRIPFISINREIKDPGAVCVVSETDTQGLPLLRTAK